MRAVDKEAGTLIWKPLLLSWRSECVLFVHFTLEHFMDLSTWDFDPHLLDQASLSKHVASESVDRFVTHTWTCQNVSLSVSRAYCHKNIKLLPPPHVCHFSSYLYGWKWEMTRLVGGFNKIAGSGSPGSYSQACLEVCSFTTWCGHFGFADNTWNAGSFQI